MPEGSRIGLFLRLQNVCATGSLALLLEKMTIDLVEKILVGQNLVGNRQTLHNRHDHGRVRLQ